MARPSCRDALVAFPFVLAIAAIVGGSRVLRARSVSAGGVGRRLPRDEQARVDDVRPDAGPVGVRREAPPRRHDVVLGAGRRADLGAGRRGGARGDEVERRATTVRAADAKTQTAACTMSRNDVVDLVLAPATAPPMAAADVGAATSFKGTLAYQFAAVDGSSCEDQLTELGRRLRDAAVRGELRAHGDAHGRREVTAELIGRAAVSDVRLPIGAPPLTSGIRVLDFEESRRVRTHSRAYPAEAHLRERGTDPGLILSEKPPTKHPREAAVSTAGPAGAGTPEEETANAKT